MKQMAFEFILEELPEVICLEERVKRELVFHMVRAMIEDFGNEGRKTDDNLPE